ncbi:hypothetical protein HQ945_08405 [Phyllobacterium sp. BT25]|uniref:Uncharacterized protein n=1 Tax=Phyllobacterium pellucidum TaxID=2740464 RepID=A0A849VM94_9HYPH|nr:hypothetical protein [Phyllobacterium pellucidum]NTS31275.1 hypothetical protein [Phyllobacterium pellucidum]
MKITNTQKGPRGVNTVNGPVLIEAGETVEVDVYAREKEHIEATQWFEVSGSYKANPEASSTVAPDDALAALKAELADRDSEIARLTAAAQKSDSSRDDLKKQADELGIDYAKNISTDKLKELIDAKLAE